jgi:hypothetical protein
MFRLLGVRGHLRRREVCVFFGLVLYGLGVALVLTPVGGAFGISGEPSSGPPVQPAVVPDSGAAPAFLPDLDDESHQRALKVLEADPRFRGLMAGRQFTIDKAGPWTTAGADGHAPRLLGASFVVRLPGPVELRDAELPGALYDETERRSPPYQPVVNRVDARGVTELMVLVDLQENRVVNISPGSGAEIVRSEAPPGFRRTVPQPSDG